MLLLYGGDVIRNSIIAIIACYYYRVVMIIRNSIIAILACYYCDSDSVLYSTSNVNDNNIIIIIIIIDIHIRLQ